MKIDLRLLEEYVDGALGAEEAARVELAVREDAAAAKQLAKVREAQAFRMAALRGYDPDEEEARQLAGIWMDEFREAPVATIRPVMVWAKRLALVAAGLLIAVGSFYGGQMSKSGGSVTQVAEVKATAPAKVWVVEVQQSDGAVATQEFASYEEAQKFAKDMAQPVVQVAGGVF
jgi:anti-sigma factor RsiW